MRKGVGLAGLSLVAFSGIVACQAHAPGSDWQVKARARIEVAPNPFSAGQMITARVRFKAPQPVANFNGIANCADPNTGAPTPCAYSCRLNLRGYPYRDQAAEPLWNESTMPIADHHIFDAWMSFYDPQPPVGESVDRTFVAFQAPRADKAGPRLYMVLWRVCDYPSTNPETGTAPFPQGIALGSATFTKRCDGGVRSAWCVYVAD